MGAIRRVAALLALLIPVGACGAPRENVDIRPGETALATPVETADTTEVRAMSRASVDACSPVSSMLAAVDAKTGQPHWTFCAESARFLEVVAATDRIAYAVLGYEPTPTVSPSDRLVALNVGDGSTLWTIEVPLLNDGVQMDALRAPGAFTGSGVIVLDILDGDLVWHVGYDATTGDELWRVAGAENAVIANTEDLAVLADLYLGEGVGPEIKFVAVDRRTGAPRWRIDHGFTDLAGVIKVGRVLLIGQMSVSDSGPPGAPMPGSQIAVDIDTGKELWRSDSFVGVAGGTSNDLLVGTTDWLPGATSTHYVAIDAETGKQRWETTPLALPEPTRATMGEWQPARYPQAIVDESAAYLWHDGTLSRLDPKSGETQWEVPAEGYLVRSALGHVVLATDAETLTARSVADGHEEWTVRLPAMQYPPAVLDNATTYFVRVSAPQEIITPPAPGPGPVRSTDP